MFPLGHLGLTLAVVELARRRLGNFRADYRVLLVGALLPDLIDKPLSVALGIDGRNVAHTLLFVSLPLLLAVLWRPRGGGSREARPFALLALGSWTHLLLDQMWSLPETLLWPFLGLTFPLDPFDPFTLLEGYGDPYVLIGDVVGAAVLGYLVWKHRLYRRINFLRFLRKGRLEAGEAPLTLEGRG